MAAVRTFPSTRGALSAWEAVFVFALVILVLGATAPILAPLGILGILVGQVVVIAGVPVTFAAVSRPGAGKVRRALGLARPPWRALAGALLVGASFWLVSLQWIVPFARRLGGDEEITRLGKELVGSGDPLWLVLVAVALAPAVCEEILCRGALARGLATRLGTAGAIVASAALFALMHLSLPRLLPTFAFGLVLAYAALATASVLPTMLMHALNNGIALVLASGKIPSFEDALGCYPVATDVIAAGVCAAGLVLLWPRNGSESR